MNEILGMSEILGLDDMSGEDAAAILGELLEGEDLSGEDLSGEEAMAILGAQLRGKGKGKALLTKAIAARKLAGAQIMAPRKPSSAGVQPIGFFQAGVAAGTQAIITTQPQTWFKPMRLVVPGSIAPFFTIDNLIIGNKSQFPSPVPLPAETFIPEAQAVVMELDTVNPALNLTVVATNISGVAQNFRATFVGKEVTP
ncbi:MAG: hypothetical protein PHS34_08720 [Candidatus Omnitrophica bacterium]|nr:hypothetical protein [Candidatus Omnitrophota bacterium]